MWMLVLAGCVALAGGTRSARQADVYGVNADEVPAAALMDDEETPVTVAAIIQVPRGRMAGLERRLGKAVANRLADHPKVKAIRVVDPPDATADPKQWAVTVAAQEQVDRVLVVTLEERKPPLVRFVLLDDQGVSLATPTSTTLVTAPSTPEVLAPAVGVARAWGVVPRRKFVPSTDAEAAFVKEALLVERYSEKDGALRVRVKRNGAEVGPDELKTMGCPPVTAPFVLPERGPHPLSRVALASILPAVPFTVAMLSVVTGIVLAAALPVTVALPIFSRQGRNTTLLTFLPSLILVGLAVVTVTFFVSVVLTLVGSMAAGLLSMAAFLQYASVAGQWHPAEAYAKQHNLRLVQKYKLQRTLLPNGYFTGP